MLLVSGPWKNVLSAFSQCSQVLGLLLVLPLFPKAFLRVNSVSPRLRGDICLLVAAPVFNSGDFGNFGNSTYPIFITS